MIVVCAPTRRLANLIAHRAGLPREEWVYVGRPSDARGDLSPQRLIVMERPEAMRSITYAQTMEAVRDLAGRTRVQVEWVQPL